MDDTDNDLSDDELNYSEDNDGNIKLPCDQPYWEDLAEVLQDLTSSNDSADIQRCLTKLVEIIGNDDLTDHKVLKHFLDTVCDDGERELLCQVIIPAIGSFALQLPLVKPFMGIQRSRLREYEFKLFHPDFVSSLIAHSFLSTSGRRSFNLNLNSSDAEDVKTHWKLRCYFRKSSNSFWVVSRVGTGKIKAKKFQKVVIILCYMHIINGLCR